MSRWLAPGAARRPGAVELVRRGARHGWVLPAGGRAPRADPVARWEAAEPIHLPRALGPANPRVARAVRRSLALFERLRGGADFGREVHRRLAGSAFEPAGSSIDLGDPREIERVWLHERRGGRRVARELWARLSWVSADERDDSLRVRFSFGSELLAEWAEWTDDARRARASDRLAEALFPESAWITDAPGPARLARRLAGGAVRLSERIVYANAPGGGASFHHDGEPGQLGVLYAQLAGRTAWLALSRDALAEELAAVARGGPLARLAGTPARARRALAERPPALERLLERDARLTRRLVDRGACYLLGPGDVLLMASHGPERAVWHSVFGLGTRASLAHSYGVFPTSGRARRRSTR